MPEDVSNEGAIDTELLARLETALETLPRFTREVFLAHRVDDLSYAEIAKATGTSVKRVQREMARALFGLCRAMDGRPLRWWEWWF